MACPPSTGSFEIACSSPSGFGCVEWIDASECVSVPLAVLGLLPSVRPSVGSRNPPPIPSLLMLAQLCILFQSTHEEHQGAEASAEQGKRIAKSPLQCTITAQFMGCWAKHNGALEHIGVMRSVEMMELQRAQRFPACPTNPNTFVFAEFSPASQPAPSQPNALSEKEKYMHINWNPLAFLRLSDLSAQRILTRFLPDVWQAFFCRSFRASIRKMLAHVQGRTLYSCKMCIGPLGDHVLTCKQHTCSIHSHNHLMDDTLGKLGACVQHRSFECQPQGVDNG